MGHQQPARCELTRHARAVGLGRQGNHTLDVRTVGSGRDDHRAAKRVSGNDHGTVAVRFQEIDPAEQVEHTLQKVVGEPVVQAQGRDPLPLQLFRQVGIAARARADESTPGPAHEDGGLRRAFGAVNDAAEFSTVGMELQPFSDVAIGQGRLRHPEELDHFFRGFRFLPRLCAHRGSRLEVKFQQLRN